LVGEEPQWIDAVVAGFAVTASLSMVPCSMSMKIAGTVMPTSGPPIVTVPGLWL